MEKATDLVPDLLRQISGSFQDAADFVRFHAVCRTWRDTLTKTTSSSHCPAFLPWLLVTGRNRIARFRSIFSKITWCVPGSYSTRSRWLGTEDGAGAWLLTTTTDGGGGGASPRLVDPFTGAATALPRFPETIAKYVPGEIDGVVCSDGTVFLYAVGNYDKQMCYIVAAVLRPGDAAWTEGESSLVYNGFEHSCAAAYHRGSIVLVDLYQIHVVKLRLRVTGGGGGGGGGDRSGGIVEESDTARSDRGVEPVLVRTRRQSIHAFESRGELLAACVVLAAPEEDGGGDLRALTATVSVLVYALESESVDGQETRQRWVKRDARRLSDRVLFLGSPTSFAVDAARFAGAIGGGCAYFVLDSGNACWSWRNVPKATRVYRYSFEDASATVVEELSPFGGAGWDTDNNMMWITPNPSNIAPTHEFRERLLQPTSSKQGVRSGSIIRHERTEFRPHFKIFVGNLPSWLDSIQLRRFFKNYVDITDARVVCDTRTGRSWGYGFVTIATIEEPEEIFAVLDGEIFRGFVLRVKKFAGERPKGPFVMPLVAQNNKT